MEFNPIMNVTHCEQIYNLDQLIDHRSQFEEKENKKLVIHNVGITAHIPIFCTRNNDLIRYSGIGTIVNMEL